MARKPVFRRRRANEDIDSALAYYMNEAGAEVATDFIDKLEAALTKISKQPGIGSVRYGHEIQVEGLRSWQMDRFPYLIFYLETGNRIEILRVLHSHVDIPSWLHDSDQKG